MTILIGEAADPISAALLALVEAAMASPEEITPQGLAGSVREAAAASAAESAERRLISEGQLWRPRPWEGMRAREVSNLRELKAEASSIWHRFMGANRLHPVAFMHSLEAGVLVRDRPSGDGWESPQHFEAYARNSMADYRRRAEDGLRELGHLRSQWSSKKDIPEDKLALGDKAIAESERKFEACLRDADELAARMRTQKFKRTSMTSNQLVRAQTKYFSAHLEKHGEK